VLGDDDLVVEAEEDVFRALKRWHASQQRAPGQEVTARLLRLLRWAHMEKAFLREHVNGDPLVAPHLIVLTEAFQDAAFGAMPPNRGGHVCTFSAPFDTNGVLYRIATKGSTRPYVNPHTAGEVVASASCGNSRPSDGHTYADCVFVEHTHATHLENYTDNEPNSWMAVDLGEGRSLVAQYYCLRSDLDADLEFEYDSTDAKLRHWELQGSNDGHAWTMLRKHEGDSSLAAESMSTAAWAVDAAGRAFRRFRILQTAPTVNGDHHLACTGIELYGRLKDRRA
jgi:hypothetical protein